MVGKIKYHRINLRLKLTKREKHKETKQNRYIFFSSARIDKVYVQTLHQYYTLRKIKEFDKINKRKNIGKQC